MSSQPDKAGVPGTIDPVLAFLDYLEEYRRSWRCWLIGGPAAVDDIAIGPGSRLSGARLVVRLREGASPPWDDGWRTRHIRSGSRTCPTCKGRGSVDLATARALTLEMPNTVATGCPVCSGAGRITSMGRYVVTRDLIPEETPGPVAGGMRRAWRSEGAHLYFHAQTPEEICRQVEETNLLDDTLVVRLRSYCRLAEMRSCAGPGETACVDYEVYAANAASVRVDLGEDSAHFWAVGRGSGFRRVNPRLPETPTSVLWTMGILAVMCVYMVWTWFRGRPSMFWPFYWLYLAFGTSESRALRRRFFRRARRYPHYLRESRQAEPSPTIVVVSQDARASLRLFALFAHLAGHAQLADPAQGGVVLDRTYPDLSLLDAPDAQPPDTSATYRVRFGEGMPGPRQARLVHMVLPPDDRTDPLCRRILGRASQVWAVLPAGDATAGAWAEEIAAAAPQARVALLVDGSERPADARYHDLDLDSLRERYLRGEVPPSEAARLVARLLASDTGPSPEPGRAVPEGRGEGRPVAQPVRSRR